MSLALTLGLIALAAAALGLLVWRERRAAGRERGPGATPLVPPHVLQFLLLVLIFLLLGHLLTLLTGTPHRGRLP